MNEFNDFKQTKEQWEWFNERLNPTANGVVTTSTYALDKLKNLVGNETIPRWKYKAHLVDQCYNKSYCEYLK